MNANCHKTVFSKRLGMLVAVGEHTSSTGKAASGQGLCGSAVIDGFVGALRLTFASVALTCLSLGTTQAQSNAVTLASTALPQGGSISAGSATISTTGAAMAITQSTDKASINWQSFNIGSAAAVNIAQPSATSVLLNRVIGNDPSQILGKLSANGQVILLNPNGVLFGKDGSVTASAFTASTFALSDADFMSGFYKYTRNGSTAAVVNQGSIETSAGGFVALIGATVTNEGSIHAPQGDVVMAAAETVTLPPEFVKPQPVTTPNTVSVRMSKRVRLELDPAAINTAVNNTSTGVIVTEGGQVLLQAAALSTAVASVTHSGRIDTSAPQAGAVTVLADHGTVRVNGHITANSTQGTAGGDIYIGRDEQTNVLAAVGDVSGATLESKGGFIETSGNYLKTDGITVKAAEWLLDPSDITISTSADNNVTGVSPADITPNGGAGTSSIVQVNTIQTAINAGTNVTIKTTNALNSTGAGNITIANALSLNNTGPQDATLTLIADNGITQNAAITGTGTKLVNINMTANGNYQGNTAANALSKGITLNAGITTNGAITLIGNNQSGATDGAGAGVYINRQTVNAGSSDVTITGTATNGSGTFINGVSTIRGGNINIGGTANTTASNKSGTGVYLYRDSTTTIAATNNLAITGTVTGAGTGNGIRSNGGNVGTAILMTAGGTATLKGIQTGNANNTSSAVYLSGFRVNAAGDVTIQAEAANSNSLAIYMNREAGALNGYDDGWRQQVRSTNGNVLIQSNQGAVLGQDTGGGVNISGRNVTLDNTGAGMTVNGVANANGGSIDPVTGAIVLGSGTSTYSTAVGNAWAGTWTPLGVSLNGGNGPLSSTASVTATGNLTIGGSSSAAQGVAIGSAMTVAGNINLAGRSTLAGANALEVNAALTSTGGNVTLSGDRMNIGAAVKAGSTGLNTVTVTTVSAANKIDIGSGTGVSGVDDAGTLGLSQAELNRITAGNLVIGDTANTGGIKVSAATTSNATSGNLTLLTGGNIAIDGALTVGSATPSKNLTLNGTGITSAITQSAAAIKAAGLEVLGANATHTLTDAGNDIKKLAGNTKTVSLTNNAAFAIDTVNTVGLTTSGNTTLNSTATVTQTEAISATGLELIGANGTYNLNHTNNTIQKLAGNTGTVSLTNKGDMAIDTVNTAGLTTMGNLSLTTNTSGNLTLKKNITAANVNLNAAGAILRDAAVATDGIIQATTLLRIKAGSNIGTSAQRIKTNTDTLSMESVGDQYVTEANAVTLAAKTSNNGSIDVETTDGTLSVGTSTLIDGVTANGSGNITLSGTSSTAGGLVVAQAVTANTGKITLKGHANGTDATAPGVNGTGLLIRNTVTTKGDVKMEGTTKAGFRDGPTVFAGVRNFSTVSGENIMLTAMALDDTADVLGYLGSGGNLVASGKLEAVAESKGAGVGFYIFGGKAQSGTGMNIQGTSRTVDGIGLAGGTRILNELTTVTATGTVVLTGKTDNTLTANAVGLYNSVITNTSADGGIQIKADKGNIKANNGSTNPNTITNAGVGAVVLSAGPTLGTDGGAIDGTVLTITQNGSGGVQVLTSGTGDVTVPKIINNGTGTVVVAAGTAISQGTGTGGQVKTTGNTISQTNSTPGKTHIYSGNAADTDNLSSLMAGNLSTLDTLYLTNAGTTKQNAKVNTAFGTPASNTAPVQLMLRENLQFEAKLNPVSLTKNFAEADPTDAAIKAALKGANTSTETTLTTATNTGGKQFKVGTSEFIDTLSGSFNGTAGTTRSAGTYNYSATSNQTNTTAASTDATRSVARLVVKPANITPVPSPVTPSTNPGRVKVASDLANPFALASAEDVANDACSATSLENCHCEESSVNQGVSICYEPNAGSK